MISFAIKGLLALALNGYAGGEFVQMPDAACAARAEDFTADRVEAGRLIKENNATGALLPLKRAYALCADDYENARDLAAAEIATGDTQAAEVLLRQILRRADKAELHNLLGEIEASKKNYKAAAAEYQFAAKIDPTESRTFDFGTSLLKVNFGAATEVLRYGLKQFPDSVKMRVGLAIALYAQDQAEEGARLLCEASELGPDDVHPMESLAETQVVPRSVQAEAQKRFDDLARRYPKDGLILFDDTMVKSGRWSGDKRSVPDDFVPNLKAALKLDPRISKAHFQLALVYDETKDYAAEIDALRKAIAIDPDVEQYHYRLAFAYRAKGDDVHFREELARYRKLHAGRAGAK